MPNDMEDGVTKVNQQNGTVEADQNGLLDEFRFLERK